VALVPGLGWSLGRTPSLVDERPDADGLRRRAGPSGVGTLLEAVLPEGSLAGVEPTLAALLDFRN
jgi:hypothetical protein